jgi:hypothetical protein
MRVTIVTDDDAVLVDGFGHKVDCSALRAAGLWAVQWHDTFGEEEYRMTFIESPVLDVETNEPTAQTAQLPHREPNKRIDDFTPYEPYLAAWQAANAKSKIEPFLDGMSLRLETTAQILGVFINVRQ